MPNRMDEWARSSSVPMALKTYEGSREALVQADPEESATSFSAISKLSPRINETVHINRILETVFWKKYCIILSTEHLLPPFFQMLFSPSTKAKERFTQPGYVCSVSPFLMTLGTLDVIEWTSMSDSFLICCESYSISFFAISHASPKPTTRGVGTVPDLEIQWKWRVSSLSLIHVIKRRRRRRKYYLLTATRLCPIISWSKLLHV